MHRSLWTGNPSRLLLFDSQSGRHVISFLISSTEVSHIKPPTIVIRLNSTRSEHNNPPSRLDIVSHHVLTRAARVAISSGKSAALVEPHQQLVHGRLPVTGPQFRGEAQSSHCRR